MEGEKDGRRKEVRDRKRKVKDMEDMYIYSNCSNIPGKIYK